jgi:hypothetical protein
MLHQTASVGASGLAGFLLIFGLAGAAASGWLADKTGPLPALAGGLALTALSSAGLGVITAVTTGPAAVIASGAAIPGYGFGTWAITPQQQRLLSSGGNDQLLLSFNATTLYAGVGLGGAIGGLTLALSHSTTAICWTAAGIEVPTEAISHWSAIPARAPPSASTGTSCVRFSGPAPSGCDESSTNDLELGSQFGCPLIFIKIDIVSDLWSYGESNPDLLHAIEMQDGLSRSLVQVAGHWRAATVDAGRRGCCTFLLHYKPGRSNQ